MVLHCFFQILSDIILIISVILLIDCFGISKLKSIKFCIIAFLFSIICSVCIFYLYQLNFNIITILIYPLMYIIVYLIAFGELKTAHIYLTVIIELTVTLLSLCCTDFIVNFTNLEYNNFNLITLFGVRLIFFTLVIIAIQKRKTFRLYSIIKIIPKHIFILIIITLASMNSLIICNGYPTTKIQKQFIITILITILTLSIMIMILSLLINVVAYNHYKEVDKLNNDIRTFRHDYTNHMQSILSLLEMEQYTDAKSYIEKLISSKSKHELIYNTGNILADAIISEKSNLCKDFTVINFEGFITDKIDNSDLCVILSNALDNAVEACKQCSESCIISIAAYYRQGYFTLTMKNPTVTAGNSVGIPTTTKEDSLNHGLGLFSIEQTVKKYDGTINVKIEDFVFTLSIAMKI